MVYNRYYERIRQKLHPYPIRDVEDAVPCNRFFVCGDGPYVTKVGSVHTSIGTSRTPSPTTGFLFAAMVRMLSKWAAPILQSGRRGRRPLQQVFCLRRCPYVTKVGSVHTSIGTSRTPSPATGFLFAAMIRMLSKWAAPVLHSGRRGRRPLQQVFCLRRWSVCYQSGQRPYFNRDVEDAVPYNKFLFAAMVRKLRGG